MFKNNCTHCCDMCLRFQCALNEIKQYRIAEINDEYEEKNDTVLNIIRDLEDED